MLLGFGSKVKSIFGRRDNVLGVSRKLCFVDVRQEREAMQRR